MKSEKNCRHCAKINNEAKAVIHQAILEITQSHWGSPLGEEQQEIIESAAELIIEAITKGEVPHVQINY